MSMQMDPEKAAIIAARAANEMKAVDVLVQHVGPYIGVTDYFVFATAKNPRQSEAIIEKIEDALRIEASMKPMDREIARDGSWSLIDFGSVIVHVLSQEGREYYRIEQIWSDAELLDVSSLDGFEDMEFTKRGETLMTSRTG